MTSNHVNTSLVGNYKINDVKVDIYFSPEVIEAFASNNEISIINKLKIGEKYDRDPLEKHFDNIFEIVKLRVLELETYEVYFDNIEYVEIYSFCDPTPNSAIHRNNGLYYIKPTNDGPVIPVKCNNGHTIDHSVIRLNIFHNI